jgi:SNF2 family DNA or RNA helicase
VPSNLGPGDAFEIDIDPRFSFLGIIPLDHAVARILPPAPRVTLLLPGGGLVTAELAPGSASLESSGLRDGLGTLRGPVRAVLETADRWRIEARGEEPAESPPAGFVAFADAGPLLAAVREGRRDSRSLLDLALEAHRISMAPGFERLLSLDAARGVEAYEHQVRAVRATLSQHRGRVLLCDEVGLGKTIEAGLVTLELVLRGLARRVLILVPPSLVTQWRNEMREKFQLDFATTEDESFRAAGPAAWEAHEMVVASLATAKREPHASAIQALSYDLIVIDEAHHLRNRGTQGWKFAAGLRKKYVLLLTATPVQNGLDDLYNLITLLRPGQLHTPKGFRKAHMTRGDGLAPRDPARLRALVAEVMVRNRRATCGLRFTRRVARTLRVEPRPGEAALYVEVTRVVRSLYAAGEVSRMALQTLQMEIGSSSAAAARALRKIPGCADLAARAAAPEAGAKEDRLLDLLAEHEEKAIVFTRFRATQERLEGRLAERGIPTALLHGGLRRGEKERAVDRFRDDARVLLSTEVGSEGRNMQFCRTVVNFDLPWNPMTIEQRIGRVSRVGQDREVLVFTLAARGTIEDRILAILDARINLFELVVGEVDLILGNLDEEREFDQVAMEAWAGAADEADAERRMEELGDRIVRAKEEYLRLRRLEDSLFGE